VVERECHEKQGKRNMFFSQFSKNIAHSLSHEGKRSSGIYLIFFRHCFQMRISVIAAKIKIFLTAPLYNNLKGLNSIHLWFNFMIISYDLNGSMYKQLY